MRIHLLLLNCAVLLMVTLGGAAKGDLGFARLEGEPVSFYAHSLQDEATVYDPNPGAYVKLLDKAAKWYYVNLPDAQQGWMHQTQLQLDNRLQTLTSVVSDDSEEVFLYNEPSEDSTAQGIIPKSGVVKIQSTLPQWSGIAFGEYEGYVRTKHLSLNQPDLPTLPLPAIQALLPLPRQKTIDPQKPMVALTFDDGPSAITFEVLDILEQNNAVGTFFMLGNRVQRYSHIVSEVAALGHEIGLHTWNHRELSKLTPQAIEDSLRKNSQAIESITGTKPKLLRPPYGTTTKAVRVISGQLDLKITNWDVDTEDWRSKNTKSIINNILKDVTDGSIVLMHDLYDSTARATKAVIPELLARGYQLVTVSELLEYKLGGGTAGQLYHHAKPR